MLVWRGQCREEPACAVELIVYNSWDSKEVLYIAYI
jgi:hypothetical protein